MPAALPPPTSTNQQTGSAQPVGGGAFLSPQAPTSPTTPPKKTDSKEKEKGLYSHPDDCEREKAAVRLWQSRCREARSRQKDVFREMRESMRFAAGYQWPGQRVRDDGRYVANWTLREVNSKVAQLYAKNPTAQYLRRKSLDFALYNGKLESLVPVLQQASQHPLGLGGLPIQDRALLADYQHGMMQRELKDRIGQTLEVLFQYQLDEQDEEEGDFKLQFKQMVRRTIIAKVGYIRVSFVRDNDAFITSSGVGNTVTNRALIIKQIADRAESGEIDRTDKQIETLQNLAIGLGGTMKDKQGLFGVNERIVIDCLPSTSVLIDKKCRSLKGFLGANWLAIMHRMNVDDVNAIFEADVKASKVSDRSQQDGTNQTVNRDGAKAPEKGEEQVTVYEILNKKDRTHFYICDGYEKYLAEPEYLEPAVKGYWPLYALTFNDIEADIETGQTPFPPSDVELLMCAQREHNRSRNELKKHRKANRPRWMGPNGVLSEDDKNNLGGAETGDFVELQNIPQGMKPADVFTPLPNRPIEPAVYDTQPQLQDAQLTTGNPQEAMGVDKNPTATGSTITEQNKMTVTASNVDDVDDCLTWLARVMCEMMVQGFSTDTVHRLAGPGAVFPQMPQDKLDLLNQVTLTTKAASSGRPNKVVDMRNWQMTAPILQQAGANPQFMVRQTLHVVDSNIDPEEAFPLVQTQAPMQGQVSPSGGQHQPSSQQAHQPGQTVPPQQSRPGPGGRQHPQHQPAAAPAGASL